MTKTIQKPTLMAVHLSMNFKGKVLASGTGFITKASRRYVLVTNRHNVTGRHQDTGQPLDQKFGAIPDRIMVRHNSLFGLGNFQSKVEMLYDENDNPNWIEHPTLGGRADMVALPLTDLNNVQIFDPLSSEQADINIQNTDIVSVIGYPFGISIDGTAVWATGFVASEPSLDYVGLPAMLIDCRTRKGQSGSLVLAFRSGGFVNLQDGSAGVFSGPVWKVVGIYSGRINSDSDLGVVWKAKAISELIAVA
jgi:hypothetical protein